MAQHQHKDTERVQLGDYVKGRGTVVDFAGSYVVYLRRDYRGNRVFDIVDYSETMEGAQGATFYDCANARKEMHRLYGEAYLMAKGII